jgi:hypothetical protein
MRDPAGTYATQCVYVGEDKAKILCNDFMRVYEQAAAKEGNNNRQEGEKRVCEKR